MTDVLFITSSQTTALRDEANGTLLLATKLLQAGFSAQVLRFCQDENFNGDYAAFIKSFTEKILAAAPKCVSFYTLWPYYHIMLRLAGEVKKAKPETVVVFGGPQASATAQMTMETMTQVDYICTGEGENTVVPFFEAVLEKKVLSGIPGLYYRTEGGVKYNDFQIPLCDLDRLPHWDDRLLVTQNDPRITSDTYFMPIDAGRGCPFNCTFCCSSGFWRRTYRLKSAQRIMDDIAYYYKKFGIRSFNFSHDAFTTNQKLVNQICDAIIASGMDIKWKCTARINCISQELALKMKQAGMTHIEFGVETGSPRMQKLINKKLDLDYVMDTVKFLLKNGIHVALFFMYGFPEETEQDLKQTLEMQFALIDMGVQYTSMSLCRFNPATALTEKYIDALVLDPQVKTLSRDIFGYAEELQSIRENKAIFPFFYHLPTTLRNEYQYLGYFFHWYKQFPWAARFVRGLYKGDNLRFYRDFAENNREYLENQTAQIRLFNADVWAIMENTLSSCDAPYIKQLKGLLKFDYDYHRMSKEKEDMEIIRTYDFNYLDYRAKRPIEAYSDNRTTFMFQKKAGKVTMRILDIR